MLEPYILAKKTNYPNGFESDSTRYKLDKIAELLIRIDSIISSVRYETGTKSLEEIADSYKYDIDRLDFSEIDRLNKVIMAEHELQRKMLDRKFSCVGIAVGQEDGTIDFIRDANSDLKQGEVWGMTPNLGAVLVGISNGKIIEWENNLDIAVSLLFVPNDSLDTAEEARKYKNLLSTLGVSKIVWPRFFPENLTK